MRILFCTQNQTLNVFSGLAAEMSKRLRIEESGFVVADKLFYAKFMRNNPDFERSYPCLLKEWEITDNPSGTPDMKFLREWEKKLAVENLFHVVLSDRRLAMGRHCSYTQDYSRRFSDNELLVILERAVKQCDQLLNQLRPDVIIGFISVTFLEFLLAKMAKARGIKILNLRPSRIGDRVYFADDLLDPTVEIRDLYARVRQSGSEKDGDARQYLEKFRATKGRYEGVVAPSDKPARRTGFLRGPLRSLVRQAANYMLYRSSGAYQDNHVPDMIKALIYGAVINPVRARRQKGWLSERYFDIREPGDFRFAFYPMHAEPEVSLLVYGRPFVNQIEVIR
ncbi:MAG: hypothetical protein RIQ81_602, partial [Pseudomonadota bacterium]